jgi:O-acetyl-ADP-ribose deacetylase (regulator of RNase III)
MEEIKTIKPFRIDLPIGTFEFQLLNEDLTEQDTNAIVNAANSLLILGGGVAGAINRKGGPSIQKECDEIMNKRKSNLRNGDVVHTKYGNLKNDNLKYIFHAVGPRYYDGRKGEKEDLVTTFDNCFKMANDIEIESVSLPPISSGIFGYPKKECAQVFYECLEKYINKMKQPDGKKYTLKNIRMVIIDQETFSYFEDKFKEFLIKMNVENPDIERNDEKKLGINGKF